MEQHTKRRWGFLLLALVVIGGVVLVIRPAILGYGVYRSLDETNYTLEEFGKNIRDMQLDLLTSQANLSMQSRLADELVSRFGTVSDALTTSLEQQKQQSLQLAACQEEQRRLEAQLQKEEAEESNEVLSCTAQLQERERQLQDKEKAFGAAQSTSTAALASLRAEYDLLLKNTAKTVCCKEKVDNQQISSYSVLNGKIFCLEEGGTALAC
ncbi:MAG TPA: hypothetical protein VJC21_03780 [Candidatus Nanoarchaeia archaeon]|nr:hypothetical protein [Candidatus Nanoarchaeia archaeon]